MKIRLNHFISKYSSYSRRDADQLIKNKQVRLNDRVVNRLSSFVNTATDRVRVKSQVIRPFVLPVYIAFNKPEKTLTTSRDPSNRVTVFHYFKKLKTKVFAVGRLDWSTEGLLLMTNDGEFSQKVMKSRIPKTYLAKLDGKVSLRKLEKLKRGVSIPGGRVKALSIHRRSGAWVQIVIAEGKNRQIHYMFNKIGFGVKRLKRVGIGRLKLGSLKKGEARYLSPRDLSKIFFGLKKK